MNNIFRTSRRDQHQTIDDFMSLHNFVEPADISIVISRIPPPITDMELQELQRLIDPLRPSNNGGIDIYGDTVSFVTRCIAI